MQLIHLITRLPLLNYIHIKLTYYIINAYDDDSNLKEWQVFLFSFLCVAICLLDRVILMKMMLLRMATMTWWWHQCTPLDWVLQFDLVDKYLVCSRRQHPRVDDVVNWQQKKKTECCRHNPRRSHTLLEQDYQRSVPQLGAAMYLDWWVSQELSVGWWYQQFWWSLFDFVDLD